MKLIVKTIYCLCLGATAGAIAEPIYDFATATPAGSWQLREEVTTDHKGRQAVTVVKTKMLGSEERDGRPHYWIEMETQAYKVNRKGERKPDGEPSVMKVLVDSSSMLNDPAAAMNNLSGFGREIVVQTGDNPPMAISEGGMMASALLKGMGASFDYQFETTGGGMETITVPAGEFRARRIAGTGKSEVRVLLKKMTVESDIEVWISDEMPFGTVKTVANNLVNGKPQKVEGVTLEYGASGAVSAITGEPQTMPGMPGMPEGLGDILRGR